MANVNNLRTTLGDVEAMLFSSPYISSDTNVPIDVSTKECWDVKLGTSVVYHKDKTVDNCWFKYGMAKPESEVLLNALYVLDNHQPMTDFMNHKLSIPNVIDWKNYCTTDYIYITDDNFTNVTEIDPNGRYYSTSEGGGYYTYQPTEWSWSESMPKLNEDSYLLQENEFVYVQSYSSIASNQYGITYQKISTNGTNFAISYVPIGSERPTDGIIVGKQILIANNTLKAYRRTVSATKSNRLFRKPITSFLWQCEQYNSELWEDVREFYKNHIMRDGLGLENQMFKGCNMDDVLTLNIAYEAKAPEFISGSNINTVIINCLENGFISDCTKMFSGAKLLESVDTNLPLGVQDTSYIFNDCEKLVDIPIHFFDWGKRAEKKTKPYGTNNLTYMFNNCSILRQILPSQNPEENIIVPSTMVNAFNNCNNLTEIGPIIDMSEINPSDSTQCENAFNNCNNLETALISHLNHGTWKLDGTDTVHKANFSNFSQISAEHLMLNIYPKTTLSNIQDKPSTSFKDWMADEEGDYMDCTYDTITFKYCYDTNLIYKTLPSESSMAITIPVSAFTTVNDTMTIYLDGYDTNDVGCLFFGSPNHEIRPNDSNAEIMGTIVYFHQMEYLQDRGRLKYTFNLNDVLGKLTNTDVVGFYLFLYGIEGHYTNENKMPYKLSIAEPYKLYAGQVSSDAELYLPATWKQYADNNKDIKNHLILSNWTVYFGGEKYEASVELTDEE